MEDGAVRIPTGLATPAVEGALALGEIRWDTKASAIESGYWMTEAPAEVPGVVSY